MRKSKAKNVKNNKIKETKNKLAETPEDPVRDFPRGSSATFDLDPGADQPPPVDNTGGGWQPTSDGAAAERKGRTTQEGVSEQPGPEKRH
jgi:hypothetical protein